MTREFTLFGFAFRGAIQVSDLALQLTPFQIFISQLSRPQAIHVSDPSHRAGPFSEEPKFSQFPKFSKRFSPFHHVSFSHIPVCHHPRIFYLPKSFHSTVLPFPYHAPASFTLHCIASKIFKTSMLASAIIRFFSGQQKITFFLHLTPSKVVLQRKEKEFNDG